MEMNIREWSRADLVEIRRAWLEFCRNAARSDMRLKREPELAMMDWLTSRFQQPATFGLIAETKNRIGGFLIGRVDEWESVPPVIEPRKIGIIDAVYVDAEFRRQGIGVMIDQVLSVLRAASMSAIERKSQGVEDRRFAGAVWSSQHP